jgi:two-component sensor histidine kinase
MKRFSIATLLAGLFVAIMIPLGVFLVFLVAQLQYNEKVVLERRTLRDAVAISKAIEPVIGEMSTVLTLVASARELQTGDLEEFHRRIQFELRTTGNYIIAADKNGQQLLNTRVEYDSNLGVISDMDGLRNALQANNMQISNVFLGKVSQKWVFNVLKPIEVDNPSDVRVVITTKNADDLEPVFDVMVLPPLWSAVVIDETGRVIASADPEKFKPGDLIQLPGKTNHGDMLQKAGLRTVDVSLAKEQLIGFSRIDGTNWKSLVFGPVRSAQSSILATWYWLVIGVTVFAAVLAAILYVFSRNLNISIRKIASMARDVGAGEIVSPIDTRIAELDFVAKTLSGASFDRSQKEDTIRVVMQELSHRTKNLIAVVLSMVRQTSKRARTTEAMTASITERIMGLGHSIDLLTAKDWGAVKLSDLIEKQLASFGKVGRTVVLEGEDIFLRPEAVQHLGMALHELATNTFKYGALSKPTGKVNISWETYDRVTDDEDDPRSEKMLRLTWREIGGPPASEPEQKGFGTQILNRYMESAFAGQTKLVYADDGFSWVLEGPFAKFSGEKRPASAY